MIRGQEWLIVLLIVLLIFGARKLPELARSLGSSAKEFRKGIEEGSRDDEDDDPTRTNVAEAPPSDSRDVPDS
ncbi:MAG TPA: twin-arginine translocase TatA/TatE family subunit [Acidimicrobiia bacterium]|nr:twin-arginine translocase TatA/TatE family subunit [Acidimicrobiia bacterium]